MDFTKLKADLHSYAIHGYDHYNNVIDLPLISHIVDNLYVGGCVDGIDLEDSFDTVVSMYKWERYKGTHDLYEYTMYDNGDIDAETVDKAVADAVHSLHEGKRVLIHCQAGINRSNLVATRTLVKVYGITHRDAIDTLRMQRGQVVLSNPTFARYLRDLDQ